LRKEGLIGKRESTVLKLQNLNLTEAEKQDFSNFHEGQIIHFNQNAPGIKRGSVWVVEKTDRDGVYIKNAEGNMTLLPSDQSKRYEVFQKAEIGLSKGDRLRITHNGIDEKGKRLSNGQILDVMRANKKGNLILRSQDGKTRFEIPRDYGHLTHAQCITSFAAQGKSVDCVFIMQPAATFPATDAKQFYVSVSRGKEEARIYTDARKELLEHVSELGDRQSAIELTEKRSLHQQAVQQRQRSQIKEQGKGRNSIKQKEQTVNKDYER
jgi:ATP-dependent exoDNAse (exonuclease V) alpha subunit